MSKKNHYKLAVQKQQEIWKELGLEPRSYYVAQVTIRAGNIPHRVIMATSWTDQDRVTLFNTSYEDHIIEAPIGALDSFKLICKIPEMNYDVFATFPTP